MCTSLGMLNLKQQGTVRQEGLVLKAASSLCLSQTDCDQDDVSTVRVLMHAGLSMLEQEQQWDLIQQGRAEEYHGVAVHPRHLSLFEKAVLKRHRHYRLQADVQMAIPCDSVHTNTDVEESSCTIQASQVSQLRQAKAQ